MRLSLLFAVFVLCCFPKQSGAQSTCDGNLGENIFVEGDFGSGSAGVLPSDPGIAPGYSYDPSPPPEDGSYTISSGFGSWSWYYNGWFYVGSDRSDDSDGYMMVVNADFQPGIFYEQTIDGLCPNTLYFFSADILNIVAIPTADHTLPNVSFFLDGTEQYSTGNIPQDETWRTFGFTFTTGPNTTSLTLSLRNNAPGGLGNDLAIDNISFRACGPEALILPRQIANICEDGSPIPLEATILGDQFEEPFVQWQRSPDGGQSWEDIPGETAKTFLHTELSGGYYYYRYLLANSLSSLANPKCHIISNVKVVFVQPKFYEITDTICAGSAYVFGTDSLTETGVYTDSLTSSIGCDSIVTLRLTQIEDPGLEAELEVAPATCFDREDGGLSVVELANAAPPAQVFLNGQAMAFPAAFSDLAAGTYTLRIFDRHACQLVQSVEIGAPPELRVDLGPDRRIALGERVELEAAFNYSPQSLSWVPPDGFDCLVPDCSMISALPGESTAYVVQGKLSESCLVRDTVNIEVLERRQVYIPNAFSPNGDGRNDTFSPYVQSPNVQEIQRFQVYDRWGALVYEQSAYLPRASAPGWDGRIRGEPAASGWYTYLAEVRFLDGKVVSYSGGVQLLR